MKALDSGFLDGTVHPLDLAVRPRVPDFGEAVLDAVLPAAHVEHMRHIAGSRAIGIARRKGELNTIVGENGMDFVGDGCDQSNEECRRGSPNRSARLPPDRPSGSRRGRPRPLARHRIRAASRSHRRYRCRAARCTVSAVSVPHAPSGGARPRWGASLHHAGNALGKGPRTVYHLARGDVARPATTADTPSASLLPRPAR